MRFMVITCFITISFGFVLAQDDVKYIGCYSTQYARNRGLGQTFHPFSWESCVLLCQSKAARYAGIEHRIRTCYCGSYLVDNSKLSPAKECPYSCTGPSRRSCGGEARMTVYQLKDNDNARILLRIKKTISYLKNTQLVPLITVSSGEIKGFIHFHYKYNEIYYLTNNHICRSQYSTLDNKYSSPQEIVNVGKSMEPFAMDWIEDKLYYLKGDSIWEANLNGSNQKTLLQTTNNKVNRMVVNPSSKKLYYNYGNILKEFNLINKVESTFELSTDEVLLGLDVHTETIFIFQNKKFYRKNYGENAIRVAFYGPPDGVSFDFTVVEDKSVFYSFKVNRKPFIQFQTERVQIDYEVGLYEMNMLAVHEVSQAELKKVACNKLSCSHSCKYSPRSYARCLCPSEMQLDLTGRQCTDIGSPLYSRDDESDCGDYSDCSNRRDSEYDSRDYSESDEYLRKRQRKNSSKRRDSEDDFRDYSVSEDITIRKKRKKCY